MKETIIQFGEGNFLRGFFDEFIDTLNKQDLYDGRVVIVKPTPRGNLHTFQKQNGIYHLMIRGTVNNKRFSQMKEIHSISRCINPYEDFSQYLALAHLPEMRFIVSNTTEAGIVYDQRCALTDRPALSFPAKLTQLLYERYKAHLNGFVLLPCELIDNNGDELKRCVIKYATEWQLENAFIDWIHSENTFCNTLVDRIVTGYPKDEATELHQKIGYDDLLLDTAEPYHLWAIEGNFEDELPLKAAGINVIWTDDIVSVKRRKVRLLNGAHTIMVFPTLLLGIETVGDCLKDSDISAFLKHYLFHCALPLTDNLKENTEFAKNVLERFSNPYVQHRLTAIALNSVSKFSARILPTAADYKMKYGYFPKSVALSLAALIFYYKHYQPKDEEAQIEMIRNNSVESIMDSKLFGEDLREMKDDVTTAYRMIENGNIREGIQWAIS